MYTIEFICLIIIFFIALFTLLSIQAILKREYYHTTSFKRYSREFLYFPILNKQKNRIYWLTEQWVCEDFVKNGSRMIRYRVSETDVFIDCL